MVCHVCFASLKSQENNPVQTRIILASSSPFRKQLLDRLHLDFECIPPEIDETIATGEDAAGYVCRLAEAKAAVLASQYPDAVIIGSHSSISILSK